MDSVQWTRSISPVLSALQSLGDESAIRRILGPHYAEITTAIRGAPPSSSSEAAATGTKHGADADAGADAIPPAKRQKI